MQLFIQYLSQSVDEDALASLLSLLRRKSIFSTAALKAFAVPSSVYPLVVSYLAPAVQKYFTDKMMGQGARVMLKGSVRKKENKNKTKKNKKRKKKQKRRRTNNANQGGEPNAPAGVKFFNGVLDATPPIVVMSGAPGIVCNFHQDYNGCFAAAALQLLFTAESYIRRILSRGSSANTLAGVILRLASVYYFRGDETVTHDLLCKSDRRLSRHERRTNGVITLSPDNFFVGVPEGLHVNLHPFFAQGDVLNLRPQDAAEFLGELLRALQLAGGRCPGSVHMLLPREGTALGELISHHACTPLEDELFLNLQRRQNGGTLDYTAVQVPEQMALGAVGQKVPYILVAVAIHRGNHYTVLRRLPDGSRWVYLDSLGGSPRLLEFPSFEAACDSYRIDECGTVFLYRNAGLWIASTGVN